MNGKIMIKSQEIIHFDDDGACVPHKMITSAHVTIGATRRDDLRHANIAAILEEIAKSIRRSD